MELTVDRIEGNIVVCETKEREIVELDITKFINKPNEGDILKVNENGMYESDKEATKLRREEIARRFNKLFGR